MHAHQLQVGSSVAVTRSDYRSATWGARWTVLHILPGFALALRLKEDALLVPAYACRLLLGYNVKREAFNWGFAG